MDLCEGSETSAKLNLTPGKFFIKPLKMELTEGSETSAKLNLTPGKFFIKPLKMELTEGSETSAKLNLTPGKYPKKNIQVSEHCENLKSRSYNFNICADGDGTCLRNVGIFNRYTAVKS
jgi:hypothetical protein